MSGYSWEVLAEFGGTRGRQDHQFAEGTASMHAEGPDFAPNFQLGDRGRTAMSRLGLSRPVAIALQDGLLAEGLTFFDYGCGRGGDLLRVRALGHVAEGWDPVHRASAELRPSDIVNLGYVLNVIERTRERAETLQRAWSLAQRLLVVAARLEWEATDVGGRPFADGILTRRGTFQKFFHQEELRDLIQATLGVVPVAAAPGIFYVFRNSVHAQRYLSERVRRQPSVTRRTITTEALYEANRDVLEPLLAFITSRGRAPETGELHNASLIVQRLGSLKAAVALVRRVMEDSGWQASRTAAVDDLLVYLALAAFGGRPRFSDLPHEVQLDIRAFFGSYKEACRLADRLLFAAGDREAIDRACRQSDLGKLTPEALYVHVSALSHLDPLLRVYEGCGRALTGAVEDATLVKLNRRGAKVSYLVYEDFDRNPHPALGTSFRADLARLDIKIRDYRQSSNPPILHRKETFVGAEYPGREKFARLTVQEERLGLLSDPVGIGTRERWMALVSSRGLSFHGHRLVQSRKRTSSPGEGERGS